jgi:hypothetical protein
MRLNSGRLRACYQSVLLSNPDMEGRVTTRFRIGRDGHTRRISASATGELGAAVPCIVKALNQIQFSKPAGGVVDVVYPLALSPSPYRAPTLASVHGATLRTPYVRSRASH